MDLFIVGQPQSGKGPHSLIVLGKMQNQALPSLYPPVTSLPAKPVQPLASASVQTPVSVQPPALVQPPASVPPPASVQPPASVDPPASVEIPFFQPPPLVPPTFPLPTPAGPAPARKPRKPRAKKIDAAQFDEHLDM